MSQFDHLYRTHRWRKVSLRQRAIEPLCRMCQAIGRVTEGKICDHVNGHPATETEEQFWEGPFQTLCPEHHESTKKRMELGKGEAGCDPTGMPLDPRHHWRTG